MQGSYSRRNYKDGEIIFSEGDQASEAFLVDSGNVRIYKSENGRIREIDIIGRGKIFGEMGVISDMNRMASTNAVGETTVLCCERKEMLRRFDELDGNRREALLFLIAYCQELLPYELMDERPENNKIRERDKIAFSLVREANKPDALDGLDVFLNGLYKVLISYAERRLPPDFGSENG